MNLSAVIAAVVAFAIAVGLIPIVSKWAREFSLLDMPDDDRRKHSQPTPRLGGVAVFVATICATFGVASWLGWGPMADGLWPGVLIGCSIVFVTGLVDDVRGVGPLGKLLAQGSAALIVIGYGFRIEVITLAGSTGVSLGMLAIPVTLLWIVGLTNAFNLIDGVDGLAGTCALIGLMTAMGVQIFLGGTHPAIAAAATMGAVLAFLRFNNAPAKIFLGDSGSMTLGFFLSVELVLSSTTRTGWTYIIVPIFGLAYPLLDTAVALARRWLRGHPFSRADGRHIHHQLLGMGLAARRTVDILALAFSAIALMGVMIVFAPPRVTMVLVVGGGVLMFTTALYSMRWLGYHEFTEFGASVASVLVNARRRVRNKIIASDVAERVETARSVEELRVILKEAAEELGLLEVAIDTTPHFIGPSDRHISPVEERPLRVDCPVVWRHTDGSTQDGVVRFWFDRPTPSRYIGTERVISRLVPAVQRWLNQNPAPPAVPEAPIANKRASGAHRLIPFQD
jgi:UDP-GlcNAc:undecaprenyl-phosphate/decaprenyl-phosphate GlcNAc-1-phosphate transferase